MHTNGRDYGIFRARNLGSVTILSFLAPLIIYHPSPGYFLRNPSRMYHIKSFLWLSRNVLLYSIPIFQHYRMFSRFILLLSEYRGKVVR